MTLSNTTTKFHQEHHNGHAKIRRKCWKRDSGSEAKTQILRFENYVLPQHLCRPLTNRFNEIEMVTLKIGPEKKLFWIHAFLLYEECAEALVEQLEDQRISESVWDVDFSGCLRESDSLEVFALVVEWLYTKPTSEKMGKCNGAACN